MRLRILCLALLIAPGLAQAQQSLAPAQAPQGYGLAGTVVNSLTGQPVPSASVAIAATSQGSDREISKSVTTGADGRFAFAGLTRGKYSLMAESRGFNLQYFEHHDPYATAVAVGPELDSEHLVFRLQPDAALDGVISDENNEPVQNATVRLFRTSTEAGERKTVPVNQAQSDDDGHYHIGHLSPGTYFLSVAARPWYAENVRPPQPPGNAAVEERAAQEAATLDVTFPQTFYPDALDSADASPLQLAPGDKKTADIVLHAVPALHLKVRVPGANDQLGGMVFPRVSQRTFEGYLDPVFNAPTSSSESGLVEVSGLAPGHYVIEVTPPTGVNEKVMAPGWYREIDLTGDTELGATDGPAYAAVSGFVLLQGTGRLPRRASVQLSNTETGEFFRSEITDKGEFNFKGDGIRPGRYLVAIQASGGFFLEKIAATGAKLNGRVIEIPSGGTVHIDAVVSRGAAIVTGTALRDGQPFSGAMVVLVPQDPAHNLPLFRRDQSDSDGTFTLSQVVPGQYTAIAIANSWDLEWANPAVLQPYLKHGETVSVAADGRPEIKIQVQ